MEIARSAVQHERMREELRIAVRRITIVKIGGNGEAQKVLSDIRRLHNGVVNTLIVHGAGPEITTALDKAGIKSEFVEGQRVTPQRAVDVVRNAMIAKGEEIVASLNLYMPRAVQFLGDRDGILLTKPANFYKFGYVGDRDLEANVTPMIHAIQRWEIPVLTPLGASMVEIPSLIPNEPLLAKRGTLNINADYAVPGLVKKLVSQGIEVEVVFVTNVPWIIDKSGRKIEKLSTQEIENLIADGTINGGMRPKATAMSEIVKAGARRVATILSETGVLFRHITEGTQGTTVMQATQ